MRAESSTARIFLSMSLLFARPWMGVLPPKARRINRVHGSLEHNARMTNTSGTGIIGLDLGGTFLKGARLDDEGRVLARLHEPVEGETPETLLDQLARAVRHLEAEAGKTAAVGVGVPGIIENST